METKEPLYNPDIQDLLKSNDHVDWSGFDTRIHPNTKNMLRDRPDKAYIHSSMEEHQN